jgi:hypothetical protein
MSINDEGILVKNEDINKNTSSKSNVFFVETRSEAD